MKLTINYEEVKVKIDYTYNREGSHWRAWWRVYDDKTEGNGNTFAEALEDFVYWWVKK
jgi:hypothetical protein